MSKDGGVSSAYQPDAFNPNAFSLLTYRRPATENAVLLFPTRPDVGLNTLEELVAATGASEPRDSERGLAFGLLAEKSARVRIDAQDTSRGVAVPFIEAVYPSAAAFNSSTGGWASTKVQSSMATVDRANVFRVLEGIPGQEVAGIVVDSPNALVSAARVIQGVAEKAVLASSLSPACMAISEAKVSDIQEGAVEIFAVATTTSTHRSFVLRPFSGMNAGQREILVDGIFADGKVLFAPLSEKLRVDPTPPYMDRRIATLEGLPGISTSVFTDVITQVFERVGVRNTVFHAEFAMSETGPLMTDLLSRPGGGFIPEMIRARFGVDLRAAHVYAAFDMVDELRRIAAGALEPRVHVAIAACYIDEARKTDASVGAALTERLSRRKDVIAYNVETVASNVAVGLPDVRASLAVSGATPGIALAALDGIASEFGLS